MEKDKEAFEKESLDLIERMLQLMEDRGLVELEVEREGLKIRLKKEGKVAVPQVVTAMPAQPTAQPASEHQPVSAASAETCPVSTENQTVIKSPMVGTFYQSPAPDAPPFVEEGQEIEVDQVVCIVEAMKLMNEIKSEVKGKVVKVLVQNGNPVEFGQPLFVIDPS